MLKWSESGGKWKRPVFEVYPARDGYRWRLVAGNGRILADSGEAYTRRRDAKRAVRAVKRAVVLDGVEAR